MNIEVIRSRRRTMTLEVTRDLQVIVRAPNRVSQQEIERFVQAKHDWLQRALSQQTRRAAAHPEPDEAQAQALRARAKAELPERVRFFAAQMGLYPTGVKITSARTRFGSCSVTNAICFSWRLMQYPAEAIDYVVVHELAHIRHKNHGREFYALIAQILPDYKSRQALLKR